MYLDSLAIEQDSSILTKEKTSCVVLEERLVRSIERPSKQIGNTRSFRAQVSTVKVAMIARAMEGRSSMIMLLLHQPELRRQLSTRLQAEGYAVASPLHRADMVTELNTCEPDVIVLDLYVDHPSGIEDLKILRDAGYQGRIIVLSGASMMPMLKEIYPCENRQCRAGSSRETGSVPSRDPAIRDFELSEAEPPLGNLLPCLCIL